MDIDPASTDQWQNPDPITHLNSSQGLPLQEGYMENDPRERGLVSADGFRRASWAVASPHFPQ